jgi:nitroreductase
MLNVKPDESMSRCVAEAIRRRRSTRQFSDEPVSYETLLKLVEAGTYAPTGSNMQSQRFLIITDPDEIARLDSYRYVWPYRSSQKERRRQGRTGVLANAKSLIVVFSDTSITRRDATGEYYSVWHALDVQNCSAAIENMLIMATSMGLGTCWISATEAMNHTRMISYRTWREALSAYDIPPEYSIQGIVAVGYDRKTDPEGFPAGEKMHGVSWLPTARENVESYLVGKARADTQRDFPWTQRLAIRGLGGFISLLLAVVKRMELLHARIELRAIHRWHETSDR